jgi:hypothetical protein
MNPVFARLPEHPTFISNVGWSDEKGEAKSDYHPTPKKSDAKSDARKPAWLSHSSDNPTNPTKKQ